MANKLTLSAVGLLSLLAAGTFAQTATTDPVGFVKVVLPGATAGSTKYSFPSLGLVRAQEYRGIVATNVGASVVDNSATWTDDQFNSTMVPAKPTHYVEVVSGSLAGSTFDIADTVAATKTLVLATSLADGSLNGQSFRVRRHWTLAAVFGSNNEVGLKGGGPTTADLIGLVGDSGMVTYYYYRTVGPASQRGWRSTGDGSNPQDDVVFFPEEGLMVTRQGADNVVITLVGDVRMGDDKIPIAEGLNLVNPCIPAVPDVITDQNRDKVLTLGNCGLYTGDATTGLRAGGPTTADLVQIWNDSLPVPGFESFFVRKAGANVLGWRSMAGDDVTSKILPACTAIIIRRQTGAGEFVWDRPQRF